MQQGKKYPAEPLTKPEVLALIKETGKGPCGIRNRALIVSLWRTGMRIGEALALYPKDLNADLGTIRILHGKGDKAGTVAMDSQAWATLDLWLESRRQIGISGHKPLFCTLAGNKMGQKQVNDLFHRLAEKAGILKRCHAHALRHTHAFELLTEGVHVGVISQQLRHANVAVTSKYLDHLHPQGVIDAIQSRPEVELD